MSYFRAWFESLSIGDGRATYEFGDVYAAGPEGLYIRLMALTDSPKLDGVRVQTTAAELQEMADALDAIMPTARMVDIRRVSATTRIPAVYNSGPRSRAFEVAKDASGLSVAASPAPLERAWAGEPGVVLVQPYTIAAVLDPAVYSLLVDEQVEASGYQFGLLDGVGKSWVLTERYRTGKPRQCWNYGWHGPGWSHPAVTEGLDPVAQPLAGAHNDEHADPSQGGFALFARECVVIRGGVEYWTTVADVLDDAELAPLLSHEGPIDIVRHPSVPWRPPVPVVRAPFKGLQPGQRKRDLDL